MKSLIQLTVSLLLSTLMTFGQGDNFNQYKESNDPTVGVNAYEKTSYKSEINGDRVFHLWTDYTMEGVSIIVEESNRIFKAYNADFTIDESIFLADGMFYVGEGEFIKSYNFSDGGVMKVGMVESGEYEEGYGHLKQMRLLVRFPEK